MILVCFSFYELLKTHKKNCNYDSNISPLTALETNKKKNHKCLVSSSSSALGFNLDMLLLSQNL